MKLLFWDTLLLAMASTAFAVGGVCMKMSAGLTRWGAATAMFILFLLGASLQAFAMRREELGVVYILVVGGEVVLTLIFSVFLFGETCSLTRLAAFSLIVAGILLLKSS